MRRVGCSPAALRGAALLSACLGLGFSEAEAASQDEMEFNIPAGPLGTTLIEIGRLAGVIVSFRPTVVNQHEGPRIQGRFTLEQALDRATHASGLRVDVTTSGYVTVLEAAPAVADSPAAGIGAAPSAPQPASEPEAVALPPVVVRGSGQLRVADGLRALQSGSATRTDTPLSELPQAVSVLTNDALELQGAHLSRDAMLRYIPGATVNLLGGTEPVLFVRGLQVQYALSGMRTIRGEMALDTVFIDRIEVPKGPTGVLGRVSDFGGHGGTVNLVRKQAGPLPVTEISQSLSSQDGGTLRLSADLGNELAPGTFGRVITYASLSGRTEGGYTHLYSGGLLGSLVHQDGDLRASLTVQIDRRRDTPAPASQGGEPIPEVNGTTPVQPGIKLPRHPNDRLLSSYADLAIDLQWRLSPRWRVTWQGHAEALRVDGRSTDGLSGTQFSHRNVPNVTGMQAGLIGDVELGRTQHKLLLGADLDRIRQQGSKAHTSVEGEFPRLRVQQIGVLVQDQISAGPWRARLAVQHTRNVDTALALLDNTATTNLDAGVLYQWRPGVAVYAGNQRSVNSQSSFAIEPGDMLLPQPVRQIQFGTRIDLPGHRLGLAVEAFNLHQDNLFTLSSTELLPAKGIPGRFVRGVDIDLSGEVRPGLQVRLGAVFMHAVAYEFNSENLDIYPSRASGIPARSLSLLVRHDLPGANEGHTRIGIGFQAYSNSLSYPVTNEAGDSSPQGLRLPGGAQLDVSYERSMGAWTFNAFVNNVFNRQLYSGHATTDYAPLQPGRSLRLTATFKN